MKLKRLGITLMLICLWLLNSAQPLTAYTTENHTPMNNVQAERMQPIRLVGPLDGSSPTFRPGIRNDAASYHMEPTASNPYFGLPVAIDGDVAIVGAGGIDSAYVFNRNQGGANIWGAVKGLYNLAQPGSAFYSVSVSGDIAVVGAPGVNQAHVFYRNQGGADNWEKVKTIQGSGELGCDVSISGDTMIIGARTLAIGNEGEQGAAYIFQRNQGGTDNWGLVKQITASDGAAGDWFGGSLSISGDIAVVATSADIGGKIDQGAAYVFYRNQGGANNWGQVKKIVAADGAASDYFGDGVSIYGDQIVVGASGADVNGNINQGAAYVFYRNRGGADNWGQIRKLVASDGTTYDVFGIWGEVSVYQDTIAIGAAGADVGGHVYQGAAYIFYRNQGGADNWGQARKLTAFDGVTGDMFGNLQISGNTIVVGTRNAEAAYVFYRDQGGTNNWGLVKKLLMPDLAPPTNPTSLTSPSHVVNVWSNDNTVDVVWSSADDEESGLDGYSILWDTAASTIPDAIKDIEETTYATTSPPLATGSWYFHIRAVDNVGHWATGAVHLGPFKIDTLPPTSSAFAPEFAISPFEVRWSGTDVGSGVGNYDIWVRDGLAGTWTQWLAGTSAVNATYTDIITGHTYYFRSQAHDIIGNVETDLPADGDAHTTIATYQVTGQVTNDRSQPVFNATVGVEPDALNTAKSSGDGSHALFFGSSGTYTITANRVGFGVLPPRYEVNVESNLSNINFVLPPAIDAITNGGWESGDLSGWSVGTGLTQTVEVTAAHTGHYGLRLEASGSGGLNFEPSITQSLVISSGWSRPTLSWLYRVTQANPGDALLVVASSENSVITSTLPLTTGEWLHEWIDLSAFSGQTIMLQFGFQTQAAGQRIALDEVSVGESLTGVYPVCLPLVRRSS